MLDKTLLSRQSLAERWDFTSSKVIEKYEQEGILTRNPNIRVPRYYMEEILQLELLKEFNPLSPLERRKLEKELEDKNIRITKLEEKLNKIKEVLI